MIEWENVDARHFEKFVYHALNDLGFTNREWHGRGGGDRGRDVVATWTERIPLGLSYQRKWIFQCKRWKKMPSQNQIFSEVATAMAHKPDHWVMVLPLDPTSNVIDYFHQLEQSIYENRNVKLSIIPKAQLEELLTQYPHLMNVLKEGHLQGGMDQNGS